MHIERYVVGVDGSLPSAAALAWAAARAETDGCRVVLVHVDEPEARMMGEHHQRGAASAGVAVLTTAMGDAVRRHPGVAFDEVRADGPVPWSLSRIAGPGDLLVIGTNKTGYLHGRALGSRSVQVAAMASGPVAVVPTTDLKFRHGVVVGVDRAATAAALGEFGAREAARGVCDLLLLHAANGDVADAVLETARLAAEHAEPTVVVRTRRVAHGPGEALLDAARDKGVLILGPGALQPTRSPIGSTLHDVLINANAPVIVVRWPSPVTGAMDAADPRRATGVQ